jgi:hypothetical protein
MNTETKKRGRPAGAKSTVNITLRQLNDLFPLDTAVPVGSVWLREYGVSVQAPAPLIVTEAAAETPAEEKIQFSITDFREELPEPPTEIYVDTE